ncbi:hypothetical protein QF73_002868 [Salmonella enterica subsp. enterica]|nr:hypothetical protein [Salmonella enterica subsp. enterica serovar Typhimurium]EDS7316211.1 hypothetical protein [Salmonella enterica subsp. enterica]EED3241195.1 hypothetical protein [Salmonella enterica subsp. enterica serovar Bareilly]EEJ5888897.1 hypothetical protein [Salmonella enterica subsp. enterica serovar Bareilly]
MQTRPSVKCQFSIKKNTILRVFFYVHYVLIFQTVTLLMYVFVPLAFRPL